MTGAEEVIIVIVAMFFIERSASSTKQLERIADSLEPKMEPKKNEWVPSGYDPNHRGYF